MGIKDYFPFFAKAAPERRPDEQPASPLHAWAGEKRPTVTYQEALAASMALKHPVVFRCLNKIASAGASVNWYVEIDETVPVRERPSAAVVKALNSLLQSPSDIWTRSQLIYWMVLNSACYGRVPFKVGLSSIAPNYVPTGIYPLTARFVDAETDDRGVTVAYKYGEASKAKTKYPTRRKAGPGESYIYEIVRPNLDGTFESKNNVNPLGAIGLPADVVSMLLKRAHDTASGHPNTKYIVTSEKTLTNPQRDATVKKIQESAVDGESSGQVLFLFNNKIEVHELNNDLGDIHSKMPLDDMSRMIAGAFGIPVALLGLGAADAAKFAGNYGESRRSFWEDTMIPDYLEPLAVGMTAAICPYGCRVRFDYDSVQAMADTRITNAEKLGRVTFLTRDEKREITRFEKLPPGKGGDQLDFPPGTKDVTTPDQSNDTNQTQDDPE